MSESKHTPGPWEIDSDWGPSEKYPDWVNIKLGSNPNTIGGHIGLANARLISAAPDLLEALEAAQVAVEESANVLREQYPSFANSVLGATISKCAAAIAKAKGG